MLSPKARERPPQGGLSLCTDNYQLLLTSLLLLGWSLLIGCLLTRLALAVAGSLGVAHATSTGLAHITFLPPDY
jgi:hypothetical protein